MWGELHENIPETLFLIDTGAIASIINRSNFERIPVNDRPPVSGTEEELFGASDEKLKVYGTVIMKIRIDGYEVQHKFWICDTNVAGIIGMDLLRKERAVIDVGREKVYFRNRSMPLQNRDGRCRRTKVISRITVHVPPKQECILMGKMSRTAGGRRDAQYLTVEPAKAALEKFGAVVCRTLIRPEQQQIPVRVYNPTNQTITIPADATVGLLAPVDEVQEGTRIQQVQKNPAAGQSQAAEERQAADATELPEHVLDLYQRSITCIEEKDHQKVARLLHDNADVFASHPTDLGRTTIVKHHIDTGGERPVHERVRRFPYQQTDEIKQQVETLRKQGIIKECTGSWASNVVLVKKKDNSWRMCVDYRALNLKTKNSDPYMLPRIDETLDKLSNAKFFSTLDLLMGYHQVEMTEEAKEKTGFIVPRMTPNHWQYEFMPFGLSGAPRTFQRLIDGLLRGLDPDIAMAYLDDIIVYSKTLDESIRRLKQVFQKLREAGLKLKAKKCFLLQHETLYLGHIVSAEGVKTDPTKVEAVKNWRRPHTVRQIKSFLGSVGYYRRFIPNYSHIAEPIVNLQRKRVKFIWSKECEEAFELLKEKLVSAPVISYPQDEGLYILDTDASGYAIGGVLAQMQKNEDGVEEEKVIAYGSRTLQDRERRYCVRRREMLAIVHFAKYFRPYLYGRQVLIRTDHASLRYVKTMKETTDQFYRWIERLEKLDYTIEIRQGALHGNADGLSRMDCGGKRCICEEVQQMETDSPRTVDSYRVYKPEVEDDVHAGEKVLVQQPTVSQMQEKKVKKVKDDVVESRQIYQRKKTKQKKINFETALRGETTEEEPIEQEVNCLQQKTGVVNLGRCTTRIKVNRAERNQIIKYLRRERQNEAEARQVRDVEDTDTPEERFKRRENQVAEEKLTGENIGQRIMRERSELRESEGAATSHREVTEATCYAENSSESERDEYYLQLTDVTDEIIDFTQEECGAAGETGAAEQVLEEEDPTAPYCRRVRERATMSPSTGEDSADSIFTTGNPNQLQKTLHIRSILQQTSNIGDQKFQDVWGKTLKNVEQACRESPALEKEQDEKRINVIRFGALWNKEEMRRAQLDDQDIGQILLTREISKEKPESRDSLGYAPAARALLYEWGKLEVKQGLLYRRWESNDLKVIRLQLVLPFEYRDQVMQQLHDAKTAGHLGRRKTIYRVQLRYYWFKMREDIIRYLQTCHLCQMRKRPGKTPRSEMKVQPTGTVFQRIAMDLCGKIKETSRGQEYVLVIADYYSKFTMLLPLPNKTTKAVVEALVTRWIALWGCPQYIHTDRGGEFESGIMKELCERFNIQKTRTTSYRPQSDGMVERMNATMMQIVGTLSDTYDDWDLNLPFAQLAYNSTVHATTGETPNKVIQGRNVQMPIDVVTMVQDDVDFQPQHEYVRQLERDIREVHLHVRDQTRKAVMQQKYYYDKRTNRNHYQEDDLVLLKTMVYEPRTRKIEDRYEGPFVIIEAIPGNCFRIQKNLKDGCVVVAHDRLKPYFLRDDKIMDIEWAKIVRTEFQARRRRVVKVTTELESEEEDELIRMMREAEYKSNRFELDSAAEELAEPQQLAARESSGAEENQMGVAEATVDPEEDMIEDENMMEENEFEETEEIETAPRKRVVIAAPEPEGYIVQKKRSKKQRRKVYESQSMTSEAEKELILPSQQKRIRKPVVKLDL